MYLYNFIYRVKRLYTIENIPKDLMPSLGDFLNYTFNSGPTKFLYFFS